MGNKLWSFRREDQIYIRSQEVIYQNNDSGHSDHTLENKSLLLVKLKTIDPNPHENNTKT